MSSDDHAVQVMQAMTARRKTRKLFQCSQLCH